MHRFFLPINAFDGSRVNFPSAISHQITQVLRLHLPGSQVAVIDPEGREYLVGLEGLEENLVQGTVIGPLPANPRPAARLVLCFSLSRKEKVELILQKCTEIGVSVFQPFISSRSLVQEDVMNPKRLARWQAIIREACEQSHRQQIPQLRPVLDFEDLCSELRAVPTKFIAWEEAALSEARLEAYKLPGEEEPVCLLIGPEGGLSAREIDLAKQTGWQVISLGKTVLRMETACIAASAIVIHLAETR